MVLCCVVLCCVVLKALLPEGNGRDVYPQVQVNGRAVCVERALCASVLSFAESGEKGRPKKGPLEKNSQKIFSPPPPPWGAPPKKKGTALVRKFFS